MRIALTYKKSIVNNKEANINTIINSMIEAKELGAESIIFGEAFLQGFSSLKGIYDHDKGIAASIFSEPINRICKESRRLNLDVMLGYYEKDRERISSSFLIIERGEIIYNYKRLTKGWEKESIKDSHYYEGQVVEVFEYRHKRCMLSLSTDLLELLPLYKRNEEIIFCPSSSSQFCERDLERYQEISIEFGCDIIIVNSSCENGEECGTYHIKDGKIIEKIEKENEKVVLALID